MTLLVLACLVLVSEPRDVWWFERSTYVSRSESWRLEVDPTQPYMLGAANYRMRRGGEVVWSGRLPITLAEIVVTDSGSVFGAAIVPGTSIERRDVVAVRIDPAGQARILASVRWRSPKGPHGPCRPILKSIRLLADDALVLFDLSDWGEDRLTGDWLFDTHSSQLVASPFVDLGDRGRQSLVTTPGARAGEEFALDRSVTFPSFVPLVEVRSREVHVDELESLGDVELQGLAGFEAGPERFHAVDERGRIIAWEPKSGRCDVYAADGRSELTVVAPPREPAHDNSIDVTSDGWTLATRDERLLVRDGELVDRCSTLLPPSHPFHRDRGRWREVVTANGTPLVLFGELGPKVFDATFAELASCERGSDRTFLRTEDFALDRGDRIVALEWRASPAPVRNVLHRFELDGTSVDSFALDTSLSSARARLYARDERWTASFRRACAFVVDPSTARALRVTCDERNYPGGFLEAVPSRDGRVLHVFEADSSRVRRFAMPRP